MITKLCPVCWEEHENSTATCANCAKFEREWQRRAWVLRRGKHEKNDRTK